MSKILLRAYGLGLGESTRQSVDRDMRLEFITIIPRELPDWETSRTAR